MLIKDPAVLRAVLPELRLKIRVQGRHPWFYRKMVRRPERPIAAGSAVHVVDRLSEEGSIPEMIVVGVANVDRYRDLSPAGRRGNPSGIEPFSRFVVEDLIPYVESEYRTKDYRVLMGPQAGAAFGLYTLTKRQGLFDAYILENPFRSAPEHDVLMTMVRELTDDGLSSPTFLQITCPDREGNLDKSAEVEFTLDPDDLKMLDRDMKWVVEPGVFRVLIGSSSKDIRLRGEFTVRTED